MLLSLTLTLIYEGKCTHTSFTRGDVIVIHVEKEVYSQFYHRDSARNKDIGLLQDINYERQPTAVVGFFVI